MVQFSLNAGKNAGALVQELHYVQVFFVSNGYFKDIQEHEQIYQWRLECANHSNRKYFHIQICMNFFITLWWTECLLIKSFSVHLCFNLSVFFLFGAPSFLHTGWKKVSTKCSRKGKYRSWAVFFASLNENTNDKHDLVKWYTVSSWNRNGENINGIDRRRELFCKIYHCKMKRWEK